MHILKYVLLICRPPVVYAHTQVCSLNMPASHECLFLQSMESVTHGNREVLFSGYCQIRSFFFIIFRGLKWHISIPPMFPTSPYRGRCMWKLLCQINSTKNKCQFAHFLHKLLIINLYNHNCALTFFGTKWNFIVPVCRRGTFLVHQYNKVLMQ